MKAQIFNETNERRLRLLKGRAFNQLAGGIKKPCIYMHVPKCGGTSVSLALYATVPLSKKIGVLDAPSTRRALAMHHLGRNDLTSYHDEGDNADVAAHFRELLALMYVAQGCTLIHGHFLLSDKIWETSKDSYTFISILRDPMERTISNYRMAHRNGIFEGDFDSFLDSPMGRRMAMHGIRFFGGRANIAPEDEADVLEIAKSRLLRFGIVGFMDNLGAFSDGFADTFGARPKIAHYNQATGPELELTKAQRTKLEALCAADIELTDFARRVA